MSAHALRPAVADDIPAIARIYEHAVLNGTASFELDPPSQAEMLARFETLTRQSYPYIVACDGSGAVVGYAYAGPFRARPAYRWSVEDSIYVHPDAKGQGLGLILLERLLELCEAAGFRQMIAVIGGSDHTPSIRVHEKAGFERIGVFKGSGFKFGRWLDTLLMQRSLGDGRETPPDESAYPGTLR